MIKTNWKTGQITLIPFDIGFMFYDPLTPTNKNNAKFSNDFVKALITEVVLQKKIVVKEKEINLNLKNLDDWDKNDNLYLNWKMVEKQSIVEQVWGNEAIFEELHDLIKKDNEELTLEQKSKYNDLLCKVKLHKNLYCFININGVATFLIYDIDKETITKSYKKTIDSFNKATSMVVQKKMVNYQLIDSNKIDEDGNKLESPEIVVNEIINIIEAFKKWCWNKSKELCKYPSVRPYSSNKHFKHNGFSYTMNILLSHADLETNDIYYLLNGNMPYMKPDDKNSKWESNYRKDYKSVISYLKKTKNNNSIIDVKKFKKMRTPNGMMYFSWSIVLIDKINKNINTFEQFWKIGEFQNLICAEVSVQSKWYIGECCVDNSIQNKFTNLDKLEKILGTINYGLAGFENPTNSQMSSLYLSIQNNIIETSRVKDVYKSVASKIEAQIASKQTYAKQAGRIITLITSILLAIFTGCSLFKTIIDVRTKQFDVWDFVILGFALVLTIGSVIATSVMNKKNNTNK